MPRYRKEAHLLTDAATPASACALFRLDFFLGKVRRRAPMLLENLLRAYRHSALHNTPLMPVIDYGALDNERQFIYRARYDNMPMR